MSLNDLSRDFPQMNSELMRIVSIPGPLESGYGGRRARSIELIASGASGVRADNGIECFYQGAQLRSQHICNVFAPSLNLGNLLTDGTSLLGD